MGRFIGKVKDAKYLKNESYYSDLYDRHTVEQCRDLIRIHSQPMKSPPLLHGKKPPKKIAETASKMALELALMFEKGNRYIQKEETIQRWMADDQARDEFYESAEAPENIRCLTCHSLMGLFSKDLRSGKPNEPDRVLFMFDCPRGCLPRRAFYDNGEEWRFKPDPCPKCGEGLKTEDKITKRKFITRYTCTSCGFTKTDELERTAGKKEKLDPNFEADRARFCLSKEDGERWREELVSWKEMAKLVDKLKERDKNKELYDKVAQIKRLTTVDLEKLLTSALEKSGYIKFQFSNPEIGKDVIIPFSAHDSKSERINRESTYDLKQLIKKTLQDTNWRLMTDGITYRLGFLSGRLRGHESEEDLLKLVKKKVL